VIPAIYNGNAAEAKKLTAGIQHERLPKMWSIVSCRHPVWTSSLSISLGYP
jgi:hypothetical protein